MATVTQERLLLEQEFLPAPGSAGAKKIVRSIGIDRNIYEKYYNEVYMQLIARSSWQLTGYQAYSFQSPQPSQNNILADADLILPRPMAIAISD